MSRFQELGYYYQVQGVAMPANLSDPMLVDWVKPAANPIIPATPAGATNRQFRDPTTAFYQVRAGIIPLEYSLVSSLSGRLCTLANHIACPTRVDAAWSILSVYPGLTLLYRAHI